MKSIIVAGGCFWGVQTYFDRIKGVINTKVGYANGNLINPKYEDVLKGNTGHAEAIYIEYDESILSLKEMLNKYWNIIDPTLHNKQGEDTGPQYRTGIYYTDEKDLEVINQTKIEVQKKYLVPIVTEILPLYSFYKGEEHHQKYLEKNPNGYCHINLPK